MIQNLTITDPIAQDESKMGFIARFCNHFIRDHRDLPFIGLMARITFIQIPFALCFFIFPQYFNMWAGIAYTLWLLIFGFGPFTLMLHNTSHGVLFKKEYKLMNNYIPWVLGLFYGQPPKSYYAHHIGMHHAENNMEKDLSSTIIYKRDSFIGFMHYFLKFFFMGLIDLASYFKGRKMKKFFKFIVRGETVFFVAAILLAVFVNFWATFWVFILPMILIRFLMMAGNWGQHAFVDINDPENNYKNSITCINSRYNKVAFNDGYHIGHHLRPGMHWTDMPVEFQENMSLYAQEKAIVFKSLDFFIVWFLLMTKSYGVLAKNYVDLAGENKSKEEIISLLKSRTQWKR